jgi:hypothetical protein
MRLLLAGAALIGLGLLGSAPALADGPATPAPSPTPAAPMILNMLSRPTESQEAAFRQSIRDAVREGESGPGAARTGGPTLTIVVKDPCPDGEMFHDAALVQRSRPGRTRR